MSLLRLTPRQRERLEQHLRLTRDALLYRRILAVLEVAAGRSVAAVARLLRTSRVSVHQWLRRYQEEPSLAGLADQRGGNNPTLWTDEWQAVLRAALAMRPDTLGYPAVEWTVRLLHEHLTRYGGRVPSQAAIRRQLHALGYAWKRPRYALEPDPEREKKNAHPPPPAEAGAARGAPVRGRNRPAVVATLARRLEPARPAQRGAAERRQCPAGGVRDVEH